MRIYKPGEFSLIIGVSIQTLRRWDKEGVLPAHRTPKGTRFYTQEDVDKYLAGGENNGNRVQ